MRKPNNLDHSRSKEEMAAFGSQIEMAAFNMIPFYFAILRSKWTDILA
jgi:hypothetical protein